MIRIIADTSTLYSTAQAQEAGFDVSPLVVNIADRSYREFDEISSEEFVDIIRQGHMPRSSQPAIGEVSALQAAFPRCSFEIHPLSPAFITQGGPECVAVQYVQE